MIIWDVYSADVITADMMTTILEEGLVITAVLMAPDVIDMIDLIGMTGMTDMMIVMLLAADQSTQDSRDCSDELPCFRY